jgi:dTDP-4-amino-4,6-dideoxygalactose transaminase
MKVNNLCKIPLVSINRENKFFEKKIYQSIKKNLSNNSLVLGSELTKFEEEFSAFCGVDCAIGTGNGFDALYIALKTLGVGHGDEVIVPVNSFIASALAVSQCGATPIFIDCNKDNFTMNINSLPSLITRKTKAVIPVHLHGVPVDMISLLKLTARYKIFVIEDCAQAHGAKINSKRVGSFGDMAAFSFYPTKNLGCLGDGGCITTNNQNLMRKAKSLRNYGSFSNKAFDIQGVNSRLDSIQASILSIKLKYLDSWNEKRTELAGIYMKYLEKTDSIVLPASDLNKKSVWHLFVIRCLNGTRNKLRMHLENQNIVVGIHYEKTINATNAYRVKNKFDNADRNAKQMLSLPIHPYLKKSEVKRVAMAIKNFYS